MASTQLRGYASALLAAALVGFTPVASKLVLSELSLTTFGALWFGCAGGYALIFLAVRGRARELLLARRETLFAAAVGVSNGVAGLLFFRSIQLSNPALVAFYTRTGTIVTVLTGVIIFRERLSPRDWLAVLLVVGGSLVLSSGASRVEIVSLGLVMLSMVATSTSYAFAKSAVVGAEPLVLVAYRGVFSSLTFLTAALVSGTWSMSFGANWWALPVGALFGPFLSFVFLFGAFRALPLSRASAVHAVYPIFSSLYAPLFLAAVLAPSQWVGGVLATAGVVLLVGKGSAPPAPALERGGLEGRGSGGGGR